MRADGSYVEYCSGKGKGTWIYIALDDKHLVLSAHISITQFNLQTTPCLPLAFVRVHQMAPPQTVVTTSSCSLLLIYRPRKDERLSWPSWLAYSGRFTHISCHPSAVGRAQDSEISPDKDQRSTAEPRNQPRADDKRGKHVANVCAIAGDVSRSDPNVFDPSI